jgi:RNA polymerase sigma factor (sigma-70 family)
LLDTMTSEDLNAVVRALYPRIKRFFRNKLPEPDCYDQANETIKDFLAADRSRVRNPRTYLWGIARMKVLQVLQRRRPTEQFDSTQISIADLGTSQSARLDRRNLLLNALRTLPVDHQVAFELRHAEEMSMQEVADTLEVSLATAKRYVQAAREQLAAVLRPAGTGLSEQDAAEITDAYRNG